MPKPHGTYLNIKHRQKIKHFAKRDKKTVSVKSEPSTVQDLDAMQRKMAALQDWIKNGALSSKSREDEIRDRIAEAIELFEKHVEKYQDYEKLERELQVPIHDILQTQQNLASHGDLLALAIALCKVFQVLVKTVGRE